MKPKQSHKPRGRRKKVKKAVLQTSVKTSSSAGRTARESSVFATGIAGKYGFWRNNYLGMLALIFKQNGLKGPKQLAALTNTNDQAWNVQLQLHLRNLQHPESAPLITKKQTIHQIQQLMANAGYKLPELKSAGKALPGSPSSPLQVQEPAEKPKKRGRKSKKQLEAEASVNAQQQQQTETPLSRSEIRAKSEVLNNVNKGSLPLISRSIGHIAASARMLGSIRRSNEVQLPVTGSGHYHTSHNVNIQHNDVHLLHKKSLKISHAHVANHVETVQRTSQWLQQFQEGKPTPEFIPGSHRSSLAGVVRSTSPSVIQAAKQYLNEALQPQLVSRVQQSQVFGELTRDYQAEASAPRSLPRLGVGPFSADMASTPASVHFIQSLLARNAAQDDSAVLDPLTSNHGSEAGLDRKAAERSAAKGFLARNQLPLAINAASLTSRLPFAMHATANGQKAATATAWEGAPSSQRIWRKPQGEQQQENANGHVRGQEQELEQVFMQVNERMEELVLDQERERAETQAQVQVLASAQAEHLASVQEQEQTRLQAQEQARIDEQEQTRVQAQDQARIQEQEQARIQAEEQVRIDKQELKRFQELDRARVQEDVLHRQNAAQLEQQVRVLQEQLQVDAESKQQDQTDGREYRRTQELEVVQELYRAPNQEVDLNQARGLEQERSQESARTRNQENERVQRSTKEQREAQTVQKQQVVQEDSAKEQIQRQNMALNDPSSLAPAEVRHRGQLDPTPAPGYLIQRELSAAGLQEVSRKSRQSRNQPENAAAERQTARPILRTAGNNEQGSMLERIAQVAYAQVAEQGLPGFRRQERSRALVHKKPGTTQHTAEAASKIQSNEIWLSQLVQKQRQQSSNHSFVGSTHTSSDSTSPVGRAQSINVQNAMPFQGIGANLQASFIVQNAQRVFRKAATQPAEQAVSSRPRGADIVIAATGRMQYLQNLSSEITAKLAASSLKELTDTSPLAGYQGTVRNGGRQQAAERIYRSVTDSERAENEQQDDAGQGKRQQGVVMSVLPPADLASEISAKVAQASLTKLGSILAMKASSSSGELPRNSIGELSRSSIARNGNEELRKRSIASKGNEELRKRTKASSGNEELRKRTIANSDNEELLKRKIARNDYGEPLIRSKASLVSEGTGQGSGVSWIRDTSGLRVERVFRSHATSAESENSTKGRRSSRAQLPAAANEASASSVTGNSLVSGQLAAEIAAKITESSLKSIRPSLTPVAADIGIQSSSQGESGARNPTAAVRVVWREREPMDSLEQRTEPVSSSNDTADVASSDVSVTELSPISSSGVDRAQTEAAGRIVNQTTPVPMIQHSIDRSQGGRAQSSLNSPSPIRSNSQNHLNGSNGINGLNSQNSVKSITQPGLISRTFRQISQAEMTGRIEAEARVKLQTRAASAIPMRVQSAVEAWQGARGAQVKHIQRQPAIAESDRVQRAGIASWHQGESADEHVRRAKRTIGESAGEHAHRMERTIGEGAGEHAHRVERTNGESAGEHVRRAKRTIGESAGEHVHRAERTIGESAPDEERAGEKPAAASMAASRADARTTRASMARQPVSMTPRVMPALLASPAGARAAAPASGAAATPAAAVHRLPAHGTGSMTQAAALGRAAALPAGAQRSASVNHSSSQSMAAASHTPLPTQVQRQLTAGAAFAGTAGQVAPQPGAPQALLPGMGSSMTPARQEHPASQLSRLEHKQAPTVQADSALAAAPLEMDWLRAKAAAAEAPPPAAPVPQGPPELSQEQLQELVKQLPQLDVAKIADKVFREIEKRMKFERQRRGL